MYYIEFQVTPANSSITVKICVYKSINGTNFIILQKEKILIIIARILKDKQRNALEHRN
jgi:hypothetical protein